MLIFPAFSISAFSRTTYYPSLTL